MPGKLVIDTQEFLGALSRLKPAIPRKKAAGIKTLRKINEENFYIAFIFGEALFSTHGVQTKCVVESATWNGYISTNIYPVISFLKVKPVEKYVSISFTGSQLRIQSLIIPCKWAPVPDWIRSMHSEALLHSNNPTLESFSLFCPKCGKRQVLKVEYERHIQLELDGPKLPDVLPNRRCRICGHEWVEIK